MIKITDLPSSLTALSIDGHRHYEGRVDKYDIPHSVLLLKCPSVLYIPNNGVQRHLTRLEYSIFPFIEKIVIDNNNGDVIKSIPMAFNFSTSQFTPVTNDCIQELMIVGLSQDNSNTLVGGSLVGMNIKTLVLDILYSTTTYIPNTVQQLELRKNFTLFPGFLPSSVKELFLNHEDFEIRDKSIIPLSVEKLVICSNQNITLELIPPNIKQLSIEFSKYNHSLFLSNVDDTNNQSQPKQIKHINTPYNNINIDSFFSVWRNVYLKNKILNYYCRTMFAPDDIGDIVEGQKRFSNITLYLTNDYFYKDRVLPRNCKGIEGVYLCDTGPVMENVLKNLPRSITKLKMVYNNDYIPDWITHLSLKMGDAFQFQTSMIPSSVTKLSLNKFSKKSLECIQIPCSVKHLIFDSINNIWPELIPYSVEKLEFTNLNFGFFNGTQVKKIEDYIPSHVKRLIFPLSTFQDADYIQEFVLARLDQVYQIYDDQSESISPQTHTLVWSQNKIIPVGLIPFTVKRLLFGNAFNQIILPNSIPSSVTEIHLGNAFSQKLSDICLPNSCKYLYFVTLEEPFDFSQLPTSVSHLYTKYHGEFQTLPRNVTHVQSRTLVTNLANTVRHLKCLSRSIFLEINSSIKSVQSKNGLDYVDNDDYADDTDDYDKHLRFISKQQSQVPKLDIEINLVSKYRFYNLYIKPGSLLSNIKSIEFPSDFNQILFPGSIPSTVTRLSFSLCFNYSHPLNSDTLPISLKELYLSPYYNQPIATLPPQLQVIDFGTNFNHPIPMGCIPSSVKEITFGVGFKQKLEKGTLPMNLLKLSFQSGYSVDLFQSIPDSVTELVLGYDQGFDYNYDTNYATSFSANQLPTSITKLYLHVDQPIVDLDKLSPNVRDLKLGIKYQGKIPDTIKSLEI
ncbi:hypothetical protein CYY_008743 [Polysphondylium violaceum]|uniref:FNIP repeat-containing protein n=1 Tax=Polysphondylium violaceum TaxID=133409 RepID=A0A8J4PPY0_9MYCE|nr:hypothetical protein CYY_008743 [Polysphondylium violaceum]